MNYKMITKEQAEEIIEELKQIRLAVIGDTKLGIEGLVKTVRRHEGWINKMNLKVATYSGMATATVLLIKWLLTK